jgi:hypothetical protein
MSTQVWINPNNSKDRRRVDSRLNAVPLQAGTTNIAAAGNPTVPAGYILQLGWDGYMDTNFYVNGQAVPNITMPGMPYYVGELFPVISYDPAAGQPYHTKPAYNPKTGIID